MKFEEIQVGQFVKWTAERTTRRWNTYCEVVSKTEDRVTLLCLDDFKESVLGKEGEAIRDEVTPATKEDTVEFFIKKRNGLCDSLNKMQLEHLYSQGELIQRIDKFFQYQKEKLD